jgi:hypothetical protein
LEQNKRLTPNQFIYIIYLCAYSPTFLLLLLYAKKKRNSLSLFFFSYLLDRKTRERERERQIWIICFGCGKTNFEHIIFQNKQLSNLYLYIYGLDSDEER